MTRRWTSLPKSARIGLVVLGVIVVLAIAVWAATIVLRPSAPSPQAITQAMRAQARLTGGAKVYATHCAYCHDHGFAPSITGRDLAPEAVGAFVRMGPAMMPAFPPSQVSDADIKAVAGYIDRLPARPGPGVTK